MQNCWNGKGKNKATEWKQWLLKEIRHGPYLRKNIILIGKLESEGCIFVFTDKLWKVTKGSLVIEK